MYEIKTISSREELSQGNLAEISVYNWDTAYQPKASAQLCYLKNQGFLVRLSCQEQNPRAVITEQNSTVCKDSCLEFFVDFAPEKPVGYINFECNVLGALHCFCGPDRHSRKAVVDMGCEQPAAEPFRTETEWGWELLIPLKLLKTIYGKDDFRPGDRIRGNFYKCGDDTEQPHHGSYTKIDAPRPDFHRPEAFADMVITG